MKYLLLFAMIFHLSLRTINAQTPNYYWSATLNSLNTEQAEGVATDASGNVITVGTCTGAIDLDPGSATLTYTPATAAGNIYIQKLNSAGALVWAYGLGDNADAHAYDITVDASSNIYIVGNFSGTMDFDAGAGTTSLTSANNGFNMYVMKLNSSGVLQWVKQFSTTAFNSDFTGNVITLDNSGNIYVGATFTGSADFDPDAGTQTFTAVGQQDIVLLKLTNTGALTYAKTIGGPSADIVSGIGVDGSGNLFATGLFYNTVDFDPSASTHNLTTAGSSDIYLMMLDASGNFGWVNQMGSTDSDEAYALALNSNGIYITGSFIGTVDFDPGPMTNALTSSYATEDVFIASYSTLGAYNFAYRLGGSSTDRGYGIKLDAMGNIYVAGAFSQYMDSDPSSNVAGLNSKGYMDVFAVKIGSTGYFYWSYSFGSTNDDNPTALAIDGSGNPIMVGTYRGSMDVDPGTSTVTAAYSSGQDAFTHKMSLTMITATIDQQTDEFNCYPVPASDVLYFSQLKSSTVRVYDLEGKMILIQNDVVTSLDISSLPRGIYMLKFTNHEQTFTRKVIVE